MSQDQDTPDLELVLVGGARDLTNSPLGEKVQEDDIGNYFNP